MILYKIGVKMNKIHKYYKNTKNALPHKNV